MKLYGAAAVRINSAHSTVRNCAAENPADPGLIRNSLQKDMVCLPGGQYKVSDNVIAEEYADGTRVVRYQPVSAWETPEAINRLCEAFDKAVNRTDLDPLLLIPILDFLCIHPFKMNYPMR